MIRKLYEKGKTQAQVAKHLGRSTSFVAHMMRVHSIPTRDAKAAARMHGNWNGGESKTGAGYIAVLLDPADPLFAAMANSKGRVLKHRLVMARKLGRPLTDNETVHHLDGNPANNVLTNLQLRQGKHGKGVVICCLACGSTDVGPRPIGEVA